MYFITFYREYDKWYADVPGHTKEDNEMIMGSDILLNFFMSTGYPFSNNEIMLEIVDDPEPKETPLLTLTRAQHDTDGAYYSLSGPIADKYSNLFPLLFKESECLVWICNVTHDVIGEHPEIIHIISIK